MDTIRFDKLLLKTAFCCMASDGHIDKREIALIKKMCEQSTLFREFDFQKEINQLVVKINDKGKEFINYYFGLLDTSQLSEEEELTIVDFAIQTIMADDQIEYAEVKMFKNIRHRLKVGNEIILRLHPDIEQFLEDDIKTESYLEKITSHFISSVEIPKFEFIDVDVTED